MRFLARKTIRLGPLRFTVNQSGRWSWGVKVGPFSHSFTTGRSSFDTPGPGHVVWGQRQKRGRR